MRIALGLIALLIAAFTAWLASLTFGPAFVFSADGVHPGQLRGIAFTLGMVAVTLVLLVGAAVALRPSRARPSDAAR